MDDLGSGNRTSHNLGVDGRMTPTGAGSKESAGASTDNGLIRSIPPFVWLASVTMFTLLLLGTLILPQLLIPDEKHHADMVLMAREGDWIETGWPGIGERRLDPAIVAASLSLGPREEALRENRAAQHPPLFYVAAALTSEVVTLPVEDPNLALRLWSFRLISVLASAALPITYFLIASELTTDRWIRLSSALVPLAIPGITLRNGPMINTDALLILFMSISILFAVRVAKRDLTVATSVGLGLSTGLGALSKGHALLIIPVLVVAYFIPVVRDRRLTGQWLKSVALSGGISLVVGGWWWIRNLIVYGAVQPLRRVGPDEPPPFEWLEWLTDAIYRVVAGFWGGGIALRGRSYMTFFWILTILLILGCVVGWVRSRDRTSSSVSALYLLLLIPAVFLSSALISAQRGDVRGIQGRYFYPGLAGIAPLVVLAVAGITRRASRWLPAAFAAGSLAMTLISTRFMFFRYWSSTGSGWDDRWSDVLATAPLPGAIETGVLVFTAMSFLALVVTAVRLGISGESRFTTAHPD